MPGSFSPIQETQVGAIAYLFGITTDGTPISMTGVPSFELESDEITRTWKEKENTDTTGNVQNITQTNFKRERTVRFNPSGATRAAAASNSDAVMSLLLLVIAHYKVNSFNGSYRIRPGVKLSLRMDDNATIDIPCEQYENSAQNAALTSTPIAG